MRWEFRTNAMSRKQSVLSLWSLTHCGRHSWGTVGIMYKHELIFPAFHYTIDICCKILATSVKAERLFPKEGRTITKSRDHLTGAHADKYIVLNYKLLRSRRQYVPYVQYLQVLQFHRFKPILEADSKQFNWFKSCWLRIPSCKAVLQSYLYSVLTKY